MLLILTVVINKKKKPGTFEFRKESGFLYGYVTRVAFSKILSCQFKVGLFKIQDRNKTRRLVGSGSFFS